MRPPSFSAVSRHAPEIAAAGLLFSVAVVMRFINVSDAGGDLDEGVHAMQLLLMRAGFRPFEDISATQGPLMLDALFPLFQLYGGSLTATRLAVATYSLLGVVGAYWIGRQVAGPLGAFLCAGLLVLSATYLRGSRQALAEAVAVGPAVLAVAAALMYQRHGRLRWLILAAVLLGFSLSVKPIAVAAVLPIGLAGLLRGKRGLRDLLISGSIVAGVVVVVALFVGLQGIFDQVLEYRLRAREGESWELEENWKILSGALRRDPVAFYGLSLTGLVAIALGARKLAIPLVGWALGAVGILLVYTPLFPKHATTVIPPVAIVAGCGLAWLWTSWSKRGRPIQDARVFAVLPLAFFVWSLPQQVGSDLRLMHVPGNSEPPSFSDEADAVESIAALTSPGDFVVTDNPYLVVLADRLVPPDLADSSKTRVRSRELTGKDLVAAATSYPTPVTLLWTDRFKPLKTFTDWLDDRYRVVKMYGREGDSAGYVLLREDADLEKARTALTAELTPSGAEFGDELRLIGTDLEQARLPVGGSTGLEIAWEATRKPTADYQLMLKLVGPEGQVWDDENLSLFARGDDVSEWDAGRWVVQVTTVEIPPEAPSGTYEVLVGLYDSTNELEVPVRPAASATKNQDGSLLLVSTLEVGGH